MVVPWVLGNVISGSPVLFEPFVESAKYAAEYRNYHWQHIRKSTHSKGVVIPTGISPYPNKSDPVLDKPDSDGGGNFGRLARTGMMDDYLKKLNDVQLCGINTVYWREFLKTFQENTTDHQARIALERLKHRVRQTTDVPSHLARTALSIVAELERLLDSTG